MAIPNSKNDLNDLFPNLRNVLESYGKALVENYREGLEDGGHIATKNLYNSVKAYVRVDKSSYLVEFTMPDYGEYLEQGTKPHFPPIDAIQKWIRVKKIVPRRDDQGKLPTEKQLAYLIARKISEDGTERTGLFEKANTLTLNEWEKKIEKALNDDLDLNLVEIIETLNGPVKKRPTRGIR